VIASFSSSAHLCAVGVFVKDVEVGRSHDRVTQRVLLYEEARIGTRLGPDGSSGKSRDALDLGGAELHGPDVRSAAVGTRSIEAVQHVVPDAGAGVHCRTVGFHHIKIRCSASSDVGKAEINISRISRTRLADKDIVLGIKRRINQSQPTGDTVQNIQVISRAHGSGNKLAAFHPRRRSGDDDPQNSCVERTGALDESIVVKVNIFKVSVVHLSLA
jgi:hypothetical protein